MKIKSFVCLICFLLIAMCNIEGTAAADEYNSIDVSMDLSKNTFTGPEDVTVTIRVSNVGDDSIPGPVYLYDPDGNAITDFGDGGAVNLGLGEFAAWTGTWYITQKQLDIGRISFMIKYPVPDDQGNLTYKSKYYSKAITLNIAEPGLAISRDISASTALKDQKVTITYDLRNTGNVTLTNIKVVENKSISSKAVTLDALAVNENKQVTFEVTMGCIDLTSNATISYQYLGSNDHFSAIIEAAKITSGEDYGNGNQIEGTCPPSNFNKSQVPDEFTTPSAYQNILKYMLVLLLFLTISK